MKKFFILIISLCTTMSLIFANENDYYWREYIGTVPLDAINGGQSANKVAVFIGQAYVKNEGLVVVQITPGVKEVYAPMKGVKNVTKYIKILCGRQDEFSWLQTNSTRLHIDLLNRKPVIGGHEDGSGSIYIGRISYEGTTQLGKITAYNVGNSLFRWADVNKKESTITSYEVLIHENEKPKVKGV